MFSPGRLASFFPLFVNESPVVVAKAPRVHTCDTERLQQLGHQPPEVYARSGGGGSDHEIVNTTLVPIRPDVAERALRPSCHLLPTLLLRLQIATLAMPTATRHVADWQRTAPNTRRAARAFWSV